LNREQRKRPIVDITRGTDPLRYGETNIHDGELEIERGTDFPITRRLLLSTVRRDCAVRQSISQDSEVKKLAGIAWASLSLLHTKRHIDSEKTGDFL
jgi:hypothetical protein